MTNLIRSNFQDHPFHLVSPSPWPFNTSVSLFTLAVCAALSMHSFSSLYLVLYLALFVWVSTMSFWFRDVIIESTATIRIYFVRSLIILLTLIYYKQEFFALATASVVTDEKVSRVLSNYKLNYNSYRIYENNPDNFGYYLAGLLEGDGHISIPALFKNSQSARVFNPRIVFTSHIDNLGLYGFIQSELGNIGRFQVTGPNSKTLRYIIGDLKGIQILINLMHGKFRTPKNQTFNNLIDIINSKCSLNIQESLLDISDFKDNSWLTGFTESDGSFGIKYVEGKAKSDTMKRSRSEHVTLKYRLDQRAYDKPTSSTMLPFMEKLALFLDCSVKSYSSNKTQAEVLSLTVSAIGKLEPLVNYFDKYSLIGDKLNDYKKWRIAYDIIIAKEHLTSEGKAKIKALTT